jgi:hypothetical protein
MLVPLYGFLRGDTIGLLVLVHETDTVREIGRKLQEAAAVRVAEVGLQALERVDVIPKEE